MANATYIYLTQSKETNTKTAGEYAPSHLKGAFGYRRNNPYALLYMTANWQVLINPLVPYLYIVGFAAV